MARGDGGWAGGHGSMCLESSVAVPQIQVEVVGDVVISANGKVEFAVLVEIRRSHAGDSSAAQRSYNGFRESPVSVTLEDFNRIAAHRKVEMPIVIECSRQHHSPASETTRRVDYRALERAVTIAQQYRNASGIQFAVRQQRYIELAIAIEVGGHHLVGEAGLG